MTVAGQGDGVAAGRHFFVAGGIRAPRPVCDNGRASVTVTFTVRNLGPDAGVGFVGELLLGETDVGNSATELRRNFAVNTSETVTVTRSVSSAALAAGNVTTALSLETEQGHASTGTLQVKRWRVSDFSAAFDYDTAGCVPVLVDDARTGRYETPLTLTPSLNDTIPPGSSTPVYDARSANGGHVVRNSDGTVTYTPANGFYGPDTFSYRVTGPYGEQRDATVTINVPAPAAVLVDDARTGRYETPLTLTPSLNDTIPPGSSTPQYDPVTTNGGSVVRNSDGTVTYTPPAGFVGADTFTYRVTGPDGAQKEATVTITVREPEVPLEPADLVDDSGSTIAGTPVSLEIMANDDVPDGSTGWDVDTTSSNGGTVVDNGDGTVTYTPPAGFVGTDTFTYRVTGPDGVEVEATVTVTVTEGDEPSVPMVPGGVAAAGLLGLVGAGTACMRGRRED